MNVLKSSALLRQAALIALLLALIPLAFRSGLGLFIVPPYALVGAVLTTRRPGNAIGWILVASGAAFAILLVPSIHATVAEFEAGQVPAIESALAVLTSGATGMALFLLFFVLAAIFPSGEWPAGPAGRLARLAALMGTAATIASVFTPTISIVLDGQRAPLAVRNPLAIEPSLPIWRVLNPDVLTFPIMLLVVAAAVSLVVRYRRAVGVERQQLRWVVSAIAFMVLAVIVGFTLTSIDPTLADSGPAWIPALVAYPCVPLAIGIAVMRYRLYEIDRIISRTISWGITTGVVAMMFVGLIIGLQSLLTPVTRENTLAVAGSTLIAFAIFQPLRRRVQRTVDRRFNRSRYDAEHLISAFAGRVRDEVGFEQLNHEVISTAIATVQPSGAGLWLRQPASNQ